MAKRKRNANKAARTRAAHKAASEDAMQVDPPTKDAAPSGTSPSPARKQRVRTVSPRSLLDMKSSFELTYTVYRAIQAHERLYKDAGVLHGDINPNTILILDWPADEAAGRPRPMLDGALVDFDVPYSVEGLRHLVHPWPCKWG
ncbi:hypothetical protein L226DRAFT_569972 [Lentinus tigrinus ALCF2SS1-7]|uniref:Fungal-type protein kinase domain-containing protein n=1 Tax=Lentinus tigrinus ALCF2SS1-6 TaxID=1328759 RepID=A0A5C2S9U5_9APHY|nr:hypothetical protein L227DRAFT_653185 [Lentinus tigrinus ALCF2SS1-6]RPD75715.1 hypothetical protein L226DRAFT_569972 [Lentinus tigrinus ALCF2SS1-7]